MMKTFRNILFWCHLSAGVVAGLIILVMSATGVLLTYERQMMESANRNAYSIAPPAPGASPENIQSLLEKVRTAQGESPESVTLRADAQAPIEVSYGREQTLFVHPYTGQVLGEGAQGLRGVFGTITDWHRWLGREGEGRNVGRAITGACNLAFLFLVTSGLYLWWPRNQSRAAWRNILWFRRGLPTKARDFNWHNVIGFWCLLPLFVIVLSGVVISYPWASNLVFRSVGETPPTRRGPPEGGPPGDGPRGGGPHGGAPRAANEASNPDADNREAVEGAEGDRGVSLVGLDEQVRRAKAQVPTWRTINFRLPHTESEPLVFSIDSGTGGQPQHRGQLTIDSSGSQTPQWEPFESQSRGQRLRAFFRFAHTGEFGGLVGQTLAGLVSLGGVFLVWTGLALTWRRARSFRDRKARRNAPQAPAADG